MSLEDELKLQKANQKISDLMTELNEAKEKISDLMTQYNEAKNKEIMLSGDVRSLQAELKATSAQIKNSEILNERIEFLDRERRNLEEQVINLENKLETKEKKVEELLESKNEILQKLNNKELEIQNINQKVIDLREKFKKSSSDLLNKTIELDKILKKTNVGQKQDLNQQKSSEKGSLVQGLNGTRVISNLEDIVRQIKEILPKGKSTIRLVLPDIHDLEKFEIVEILKKIPENVILNIAAKIENPFDDTFVREIKNYAKLTNYTERKFIALNVDLSQFLIGIFKGNEIIGIFTEVSELIDIFKQTIMEPFIKGRKIF